MTPLDELKRFTGSLAGGEGTSWGGEHPLPRIPQISALPASLFGRAISVDLKML